jgi:hypothetical protein
MEILFHGMLVVADHAQIDNTTLSIQGMQNL